MTDSAPTDVSVATRIVRRILDAEIGDTEAALLPPLYRSVDPNALDAVIESSATASVTFTYADRTVSGDTNGTVSVAWTDR